MSSASSDLADSSSDCDEPMLIDDPGCLSRSKPLPRVTISRTSPAPSSFLKTPPSIPTPSPPQRSSIYTHNEQALHEMSVSSIKNPYSCGAQQQHDPDAITDPQDKESSDNDMADRTLHTMKSSVRDFAQYLQTPNPTKAHDQAPPPSVRIDHVHDSPYSPPFQASTFPRRILRGTQRSPLTNIHPTPNVDPSGLAHAYNHTHLPTSAFSRFSVTTRCRTSVPLISNARSYLDAQNKQNTRHLLMSLFAATVTSVGPYTYET